MGTRAAFAPADRNALKAAVGTCLGETADGSCPTFAATDATPGNPYGVIGTWDVSAVKSMTESKCTRVLSLFVANNSECHRITILTRFVVLILCF